HRAKGKEDERTTERDRRERDRPVSNRQRPTLNTETKKSNQAVDDAQYEIRSFHSEDRQEEERGKRRTAERTCGVRRGQPGGRACPRIDLTAECIANQRKKDARQKRRRCGQRAGKPKNARPLSDLSTRCQRLKTAERGNR